MHRVEYTLLDVESSPVHVLFPRCVLVQEVFSAELWIPDERELAEDPLFQAPVSGVVPGGQPKHPTCGVGKDDRPEA